MLGPMPYARCHGSGGGSMETKIVHRDNECKWSVLTSTEYQMLSDGCSQKMLRLEVPVTEYVDA